MSNFSAIFCFSHHLGKCEKNYVVEWLAPAKPKSTYEGYKKRFLLFWSANLPTIHCHKLGETMLYSTKVKGGTLLFIHPLQLYNITCCELMILYSILYVVLLDLLLTNLPYSSTSNMTPLNHSLHVFFQKQVILWFQYTFYLFGS